MFIATEAYIPPQKLTTTFLKILERKTVIRGIFWQMVSNDQNH
jgi:hypothetical protein